MKTELSIPVLILAALWVQGCTIVSSKPAPSGGIGVAYMLPRALLPVELVFDGTSFEMRLKDPVIVGDKANIYTLRRGSNVFSSDNVGLTVEPMTGLLTSVDVKSTDETLPAAIKLISGLRAEAQIGMGERLVVRALLDPDWNANKIESFNKKINAAAKAQVRAELEKESDTCSAKAQSVEVRQRCEALARLNREVSTTEFKVEVEAATRASDSSDCSVGVCYRINIPRTITLSGPASTTSTEVGVPNGSPTFSLPLERWPFVKTTHDIKLANGVLKSATTDRPSSVLAAAAAPLDLAKATLAAAAEIVQLKVDLSGKEKGLAAARVAEIGAKAELDKALLDNCKPGSGSVCPEGALTAGEDTLLSIRVGEPNQFQEIDQTPQPQVATKDAKDTQSKTAPGNDGKD